MDFEFSHSAIRVVILSGVHIKIPTLEFLHYWYRQGFKRSDSPNCIFALDLSAVHLLKIYLRLYRSEHAHSKGNLGKQTGSQRIDIVYNRHLENHVKLRMRAATELIEPLASRNR